MFHKWDSVSNAQNEDIEESRICFCGASRVQFDGLSDEGHVAIYFQPSRLENNLDGLSRFIKSAL
jgi:hypothetical protein